MALKLNRAPSLEAKHTALPYQLDAARALAPLPYGAVFHEPGLGKTKIGLDIALDWLASDAVDSVVIVTKKSLVNNWINEVNKHVWITPRIIGTNRAADRSAVNRPALLYIMHYEAAVRNESLLGLFLRARRVGAVLDEAHKIKNPASVLTQTFLRLAAAFKRRLIMTGTPVANRPHDIWAPICFLDGGKALGADYVGFRRRYDLRTDEPAEAYARDLESIFERIHRFTVRETKLSSGITLPDKVIITEYVNLALEQRRLYDLYRAELRAQIIRNGKPQYDDAEVVLKRLTRLIQCAANPAMIDDGYVEEPAKLPVLRRLVAHAVDAGDKVIVWTAFVKGATILLRALARYRAVGVHGGVSMTTRLRAIERFCTDSHCRVLVATPGSAKEGLTLTVANRAIFFDRGFSLDDYLQAQDRIHRLSQARRCHVVNLIALDTVDEWVDKLLSLKQAAAAVAQRDIDASEYSERAGDDLDALLAAVLRRGEHP